MIDRTLPVTQDRNRRRLLFLAATVLGASLPLAAQVPHVVTEATTGLFTLPRGHSAVVYLADVGGREAGPTEVTIELIAGDNSLIRRVHGQIAPGHPLRLVAPAPDSAPIAFRARAVLETPESNLESAPMLTLEVFNQQTLDFTANATCPLAYDPEAPGGKVLGDCGGCEIRVDFDR